MINVKADGWDGMTVSDDVWGVSSAGSALVPTGGIGNLQQLISLVMPQIESILARQVLEDPRALGAKDDAAAVDLPETLSEIVNKSNGLKDIINEFSFTDALNAKVSSDVYKSLRDAIKAVLIEQGVLGAADGWAYVLNQDATLKSAQKYSYTVDSTGQKSTVIALSAGFKLAEKYGTEIKKQAMADALKLDTPVDKEKLFSDLIANSNSVFYKETRLTDEQHGAAAKAALFTLYQEEFKAVKKAVTDYNADPFTDPTVSKPSYKDAVNPYDGSKVEVKDYYYVRVWLYNAGINLVKAGITAADNKSHDELTADLTPITEVPSGVSTDLVQSALDKANSLVPDSLKNSPVLIAEAKKSFVTGYNAEIPRLKKAFENGEKMLRFIADPSNLLSLYGYSGPNIMGVTGNDTLLKGGLFESNKSSTTVKAIYYDNTSVLVPVLSSEPANKAWVDTDKYPTAAEDHRGRATFDGVVKAVRDYAMQYKVVINGYQADDTSIDGQFEAPKDTMDSMLQAENWMRYGIIGDDTVLYMPIIDGYELRDKSAEIVPYITGAPAYKIPVNYDKFEQDSNRTQFTNSFFADGYQKVTFANKRLKVDYVKTMVPAVEGYKDETGKIAAKPTGKGSELTGYDVVGTVRGTNNETVFKPENTVLNFVVNGKPVNAEYKVNADGTFKVHFDKQNLPAGTTSMPASVTPVYTNTYGTKTTGQKVDFTIDVKVDHKTKLAFDKGLTVIDSPLGDKPIGSTLTVPFYWSDTDEGDNLTFKVTDLTTNKEVSLDDATVKVTADVKTGEKKVVIPITAENFKKGDVKFYKIEAFDEFGNNVTDGENQHITFNFIVVEGTLDFKVTTGNKDNMLSWTNRTAQPKIDGEDSYRDSGNTINIAVSDYRPDVSGNWHLTVNAEGTNAAPFYFTWNGQALSNQTIMKPADSNKVDDNNWKQSWDNQSGILLKADQPVKVADYSSTSSTNKAQKIVWTLHNTVDAD